MRQVVADFSHAIVDPVVAGPFGGEVEIVRRVPPRVGQQKAAARRHAVASFRQPPAAVARMIARRAVAQVDPAALGDPDLLGIRHARGIGKQVSDPQRLETLRKVGEKDCARRVLPVPGAVEVAEERDVELEEARVTHRLQGHSVKVEVARPHRVGIVDLDRGKLVARLERVAGIDIERLEPVQQQQATLSQPHVPGRVAIERDDRHAASCGRSFEAQRSQRMAGRFVEIDDAHAAARERLRVGAPLILQHLETERLERVAQGRKALAEVQHYRVRSSDHAPTRREARDAARGAPPARRKQAPRSARGGCAPPPAQWKTGLARVR